MESGRNFNEDFNRINQMEADIEVLDKKVEDYTRIEEGIKNDFDLNVKKLADVELTLDELRNSKWKKFKTKITGKYDSLYEKNAKIRDDTQHEIDSLKYRLLDTRGRLKDVKKALEDTKKEYKQLREYMKREYSEFNAYEQKLEKEKQRLRSVLKEINEAIVAVEEVLSIAEAALDKFKSAKMWGFADLVFDDSMFCELFKYNDINNAESLVYSLNAAIARMNKELRDVNNIYDVYCQDFGFGIKFMDFVCDNFFIDWYALQRIEENVASIQSFIVQLSSVKENLYVSSNLTEKELKKTEII